MEEALQKISQLSEASVLRFAEGDAQDAYKILRGQGLSPDSIGVMCLQHIILIGRIADKALNKDA